MRFILTLAALIASIVTANAQSSFKAQIHNACGWEPSTTYTYTAGPPTGHFLRVLNGAGWTPTGGPCSRPATGGIWSPGSALNAYELLDPGGAHTCVSASSGGPSGTDSNITDGSCHWKYLSDVDYITFTGWTLDNGVIWTASTNYGLYDVVEVPTTDLPVYQLTTGGCTSTIQPTGTGAGVSTADGCTWNYLGKIYYSSHSHPVPMQKFSRDTFQGSISGTSLTVTVPPSSLPLSAAQYPYIVINAPGLPPFTEVASGSGTSWTLTSPASSPYSGTIFIGDRAYNVQNQINDLYTGMLWNDNEYVSGANGENSPINIWNHKSLYNDGIQSWIIPSPANRATIWGFPVTIRPASGEGFADTFAANPSLPLAGYNANNGVAIHGVDTVGLELLDTGTIVHGLQLKSDRAAALEVFNFHGCVLCVYDHNIFEGGVGSPHVVDSEMATMFDNLFVAHGAGGALFDYGGRAYNNTIVCPSGTCAGAAIQNSVNWTTPFGVTMSGNAIFGFAHVIANSAPNWGCILPPNPGGSLVCATWQGTNNATDVSATDGNDYPATSYMGYNGGILSYPQNFATGKPYCAYNQDGSHEATLSICEIATSLSPSSVFVSWPGNYKINSSSPLYGAGASSGSFTWCGTYNPSILHPPPLNTWTGCTLTADTPDLLGTTRPQGSRYDTGAFQLPEGPSINTGGGRMLLR